MSEVRALWRAWQNQYPWRDLQDAVTERQWFVLLGLAALEVKQTGALRRQWQEALQRAGR